LPSDILDSIKGTSNKKCQTKAITYCFFIEPNAIFNLFWTAVILNI